MGNSELELLKEIVSLFKTSYIILVSLFISVVLFLVDGDPPTFPLDPNIETIDCFNFVSSSIRVSASRLKVEVTVRDFIEFPLEVASNLLRIESSVGKIKFEFEPERFWDLESDLYHIKFCALQTAAGNVNASLFCQKNLLATTTGEVSTIDAYPVGWSRVLPSSFFNGYFTEVCFNGNKKLVFTAPQNSNFTGIQTTYNTVFPVETTTRSFESYMKKIYAMKTSFPALVLSLDSNRTIDLLIDGAFPLTAALNSKTNGNVIINDYVILTSSKHNIDFASNEYFGRIVANNNKIKPIAKECYSEVYFIPSTGGYSPIKSLNYKNRGEAVQRHLSLLNSFEKNVFSDIRSKFVSPEIKPKFNQIVIDQKTALHFKKTILSACNNNCNVIVLNESNNLITTAELVASSQMLIVSDIRTLFYASFLAENTTLLNILPDGLGCVSFENFPQQKLDIKYNEITDLYSEKDKCKCAKNNVSCYFNTEHKFANTNKKEIASVMKNVFER